jgi:hypothetical protein
MSQTPQLPTPPPPLSPPRCRTTSSENLLNQAFKARQQAWVVSSAEELKRRKDLLRESCEVYRKGRAMRQQRGRLERIASTLALGSRLCVCTRRERRRKRKEHISKQVAAQTQAAELVAEARARLATRKANAKRRRALKKAHSVAASARRDDAAATREHRRLVDARGVCDTVTESVHLCNDLPSTVAKGDAEVSSDTDSTSSTADGASNNTAYGDFTDARESGVQTHALAIMILAAPYKHEGDAATRFVYYSSTVPNSDSDVFADSSVDKTLLTRDSEVINDESVERRIQQHVECGCSSSGLAQGVPIRPTAETAKQHQRGFAQTLSPLAPAGSPSSSTTSLMFQQPQQHVCCRFQPRKLYLLIRHALF